MYDVLEKNEKAAEHEELIKQRDFLSKKLDTLAIINKRDEKDKDQVFNKIQTENTKLIKECNLLRKEKRGLIQVLTELQQQLKEIT